jgi:sulfatase modifying factor 1
MKQHLTPLLLFLIAAAPTTKPTDRFEPFIEEIKTDNPPEPVKLNLKFEMLPIKGGTFMFLGNGKAAPKKVEIKSFWMAKTECTWDLYQVFWYQLDLPPQLRHLNDPPFDRPDFLPLEHPDRMFGGLGYPVISTTPHAAQMFCRWLSEQTGRKYRLPSEAEWEYACRAGAVEIKANDDNAWTEQTSDEQTHQVGKKKANPWGLHDMLGNAGEWCTTDQGAMVLRGGWFALPIREVHCGARAPLDPQWNRRGVGINTKWWLSDAPFAGFRVVCDE